ncbi:MAG: FAD-binding domain-containing protein [Chthoniobacterales bacterium]
MKLVWFKRDLRVYDNAALCIAAQNGPILPLYIFEPELWRQPDMSHRHFLFLLENLRELHAALDHLGQPLIVKIGEVVPILKDLINRYSITEVYSHQETWNEWTYQRDVQVGEYLKKKNVPWHQPVQNGVIRRLRDRNRWSHRWYQTMSQVLIVPPKRLFFIGESSDPWPMPEDFGLQRDGCHQRQIGGRQAGLLLLKTFLQERGLHYQKAMSSPVTAFKQCSRLSAHIAFGTLSLREIFQSTETQFLFLKKKSSLKLPLLDPLECLSWKRSLRSFSGRLRWHCHFIQKLEDDPRLEKENMHSAYNSIRQDSWDVKKYQAWATGKTGYPFIDACMRALIATGWINFRMRAMLLSFASQHLWLDWRYTATHLARLFIDYEPGIHYSQCQMQSGTTGMNTLRIYNPIKQSYDHDPEGGFIRRWVPELKEVPLSYLHEPWNSPIPLHYPYPLVEEKTARLKAATTLYELRRSHQHHQEKIVLIKKHASRKKLIPKKSVKNKLKKAQPIDKNQLNFYFH